MQRLCKYCRQEIKYLSGNWSSINESPEGYYYICSRNKIDEGEGHTLMSNLDYLEWINEEKESRNA